MPKTVLLRKKITPVGAIEAFGGDVVPDGWALCDGSTLDRTQYAALFIAIGTAHGEGDGSTTFHIPDLRGRFLRGMDNGAGRDGDAVTRTAANTGGNVGDAVGSVQDDAMQRITGNTHPGSNIPYSIGSTGTFNGAFNQGSFRGNRVATQVGTGGRDLNFDSSNSPGAKTNDDETRVKNANVNYIIKIE